MENKGNSRPLDCGVVSFSNLYEGSFHADISDIYLHDIAKEYHERTEAYDRTVCTGEIVRESIRPASNFEFLAINKNAKKVLKELQDRAEKEQGIRRELVTRAVQKYRAP